MKTHPASNGTSQISGWIAASAYVAVLIMAIAMIRQSGDLDTFGSPESSPLLDASRLREALYENRNTLNSIVYLTGKNFEEKFEQFQENNLEIDSLAARYERNRLQNTRLLNLDELYQRLENYRQMEDSVLTLLSENRFTNAEKLYLEDSRMSFEQVIFELRRVDDRQQENLQRIYFQMDESARWLIVIALIGLGATLYLTIKYRRIIKDTGAVANREKEYDS